MKTINFEIVRDTDTTFTLKSDNILFKDLTFYCDLTYNNVTSAVFAFTRLSDNIVTMYLPKEDSKELKLGLHKGTLLMVDSANKVYPLREININVTINRTEII